MRDGYFVIDGDGHVVDTDETIRPFIDPKFRNRPYVPTDARDRSVGGKFGKDHDNPVVQIEDMDKEGIDIQVIYGTGALNMYKIRERELSMAVHRAYNDWLATFCAHNPDRLRPVAALPMVDPEGAARELERCVTQLGFIGGMGHTWIYNHHVGEPYYDDLYACAQQYDVPISFHASGNEVGRFDTFLAEHTLGHTYEQMVAATFMVYNGIFDKFPRLRVAFLEGMCGWVPMIADRMDEEIGFRPHEAPLVTKKPSDYFKSGQIFIGCESEEWMIPTVINFLGTDETLVYSSDYPHWDGDFPNTTREMAERTDLTSQNKRNILGENARRLYPALAKVAVPA